MKACEHPADLSGTPNDLERLNAASELAWGDRRLVKSVDAEFTVERDKETPRACHAPSASIELHDLVLIRCVQGRKHEHGVAPDEKHLLYAHALAKQQPISQLSPYGWLGVGIGGGSCGPKAQIGRASC